MNIAPLAAMLPLIQEGKVRPLAFTGPTRSADLPDVPTTKEAGFPTVGYDPDVWLGILGPPGTPAVVVEQDQRRGQRRLEDGGGAGRFQAAGIRGERRQRRRSSRRFSMTS